MEVLLYPHNSDPSNHFWCPIPIRSQVEKSVTIPPIHRYLSCRTQTATIHEWEFKNAIPSLQWNYTALYDASDAYIEGLHVHEGRKGVTKRQKLDLIAISRGVRNAKSREGPPGWYNNDNEHPKRDYPDQGCEYFNVMWIEWDDKHGIAYRKELGHAVKEAWEKLDLKWIDVVLG
jgi:hypothetical protein